MFLNESMLQDLVPNEVILGIVHCDWGLVACWQWIVDCGLWSKQTESSVSFLTLSPPTSWIYTLLSVKEVLVHAGIIIFDHDLLWCKLV